MALEAGAGHLGENYVEEAIGKIEAVGKPVGVEWHMIGHVQSRKARLACRYFHWIHSLDSSKLARRLCSGMEAEGLYPGKRQPVLLECNVSGEESKFGFPAWREDTWPGLLAEFHEIACLPQLEVRGLMTMAPFQPDPDAARPFFQRLRGLQEYLQRQIPDSDWRELSMGMSADYEAAVREGATWVRIGTAILGPRG
jgi:hypothetical protein